VVRVLDWNRLRIFHRLNLLENRMSAVDDALVLLDEATTAVANKIDQLVNQLQNGDQAAAAKIQVETERLRSLAADPENPVPDNPPPPV
jgi:hypothetical protein